MLQKIYQLRISRLATAVLASIAVIVGIGLAAMLPPGQLWWLLPAPLVVLSWRRQNVLFLLCFLVLAGGIGFWRGGVYQQRLAAYDVVVDQKVVIIGSAHSDAIYGRNGQLEFDMRDARVVSPQAVSLLGSLTVSGFGEPAVFKGDIVQVSGKIRRSMGNNVARISYAQLEVKSHSGTTIDAIRRKFGAGIQSALPEPAASFALGILVGQRDTMPKEISDQLKAVGLTHIVAVSGYNLMIILRASGALLRNRSKFQYMVISSGLVGLFLLFAGSSPSIVRASVVCGLGLAAWYYGRSVRPLVLLMVSAAVTALANPLYVWGNVSWYLSFLAFFGVLVVSPLIVQRIYGMHKKPGMLMAVMVESLCAEIATLPYVLYIFGQFSFVGILANVLVVALVPLAMLLSLVAGLAGMFFPAVAGWFAWPATILITYMLDISALLSRVPHGFVDNLGFSLPLFIVSYGMITAVLLVIWHQNKRKYGTITDKIDPAQPV